MRKIALILISLFCVNTFIFAQNMNVASYNIRFNNPGDGENAWPNRKDQVAQLLRFHEVDVFGLQEALIGQIDDLQLALPDFQWIGVGREDGKQEGEFSPVFFNTKKFSLKEKGWFWLAENCTQPVLGWDAACKRICTWVILKEKKSGKSLLFLNTHFDHVGNAARNNSSDLILKKIKELNPKNLPVILAGDFNLTPETEPIARIKAVLSDSKEVSEAPAYGPEGTFNAFKFDHPLNDRIDYIFVSQQVKVKKYAVLSDSKNRRYYSDHLPVLVTVELK